MADNLAHKRIDEGVKRGPRIAQRAPRRSPKADLGSWVIPKDLSPDEIIERYLTESTTGQIAAQYGLSRKALTKWLREQRPREWKQVQIVRALANKEDGVDGIKGSRDALSLARARELVKSAQFDLTSLDPEFQPKQQVTITSQPILNITITAPQQPNPVIDLPSDAVQQLDKPKP